MKQKTVQNSGMYQKLRLLFLLGVAGAAVGGMALVALLVYYANDLPDLQALSDYDPKQITKLYAHDGELLAEYARQKRIYVSIDDVPQKLVEAYLAAEDASFYDHPGFDIKGIVRAALTNIFGGHKQGASTITQQVAKTFLLTNERTYERKIKELILARRIEKAFSKDEILELYLNQIYLGAGAYGVSAAALRYYSKPLDALSYGQVAMLAGLPRAPSAYNPLIYPRVARLRRDVILRRMQAEGFITSSQAEQAISTDLELNPRKSPDGSKAASFSEHVRRELLRDFGTDGLYEDGLQVQTTLFPGFQEKAQQAVQRGLRDYDRRHGYRGPYGRIAYLRSWQARIDELFKEKEALRNFAIPAAVLEVNNREEFAKIGLPGGGEGYIPLKAMTWAREYITADERGPEIEKPSDVVRRGDVVFVRALDKLDGDKLDGFDEFSGKQGFYSLEQIPEAQAALVALDIHTGAVRAMVGGFSPQDEFNRAVQAERQPGSAFKPIVYAYAISQGFTPASQLLDAPVVVRGQDKDWKPTNYSRRVYGMSSLRRGIEQSRNLMTIRLAQEVGIRGIVKFARRFGLNGEMPANLSTALGAASTSLLDLTSAYSVFPHSGERAKPYFIERVQGTNGQVISGSKYGCLDCEGPVASPTSVPNVILPDMDEVITPQVAYVMLDLLRGVVRNGTGRRATAVGHPVGGKTGTTNDYIDAWFVGFSPLYAVGVWVGFDKPQTLGKGEAGSSAALPIWVDFMKNALRGYKQREYPIPEGITLMRIDTETGLQPTSQTSATRLEVFVEGTQPGSRPTAGKNGGNRPSGESRQQQNKATGRILDPQGIY